MKNKNSNSKKIVLFLALLVPVVAVAVAFWPDHNKTAPSSSNNNGQSDIQNTPPTEEEQQSGDDKKQDIVKPKDPPEQTASGKQKVTPVITRAAADGISAYVPGVFEEGGTCTATLTKGSSKIVKQSVGFGNASYTQCAPIELSSSDFSSPGSWTVLISYLSAKSEGVSSSQQIEVN